MRQQQAWLSQRIDDAGEGGRVDLCPQPVGALFAQVEQRGAQEREVRHVPHVVARQANEVRQRGHVRRHGEVAQGGELDGVRPGAVAIGDVAEQAQLAEEPMALAGLESDVAGVEAGKHLGATGQRRGEGVAPPYTIVEVNDD